MGDTPKSMIQAMEVAGCHDVCHLNTDSDAGCCRTLSRSLLFSVSRVFMSQAGQAVQPTGTDVTDVEIQMDK